MSTRLVTKACGLPLLVALLLSGCGAVPTIGTPEPEKTPPAPALVRSIQPDLVCSIRDDDYDVFGAVTKRFDVEAAARLRQLFATEFKNSDLTRRDRELLKFVSRETLWIPPWFEARLGDLLFAATQSTLKPVTDPNTRKFAEEALDRLVKVAPKTPFEMRIMVVEEVTPQALAGGRIFIDQGNVSDAMGQTASARAKNKLAFLLAHEMAHIYKRHRAKLIQERLVSLAEARKLVGLLIERPQGTENIRAMLETLVSMNAIVQGLRSQQIAFLQSQEVEADACAASLLTEYKLGDPADGFKTYALERVAHRDEAVYADHPPDAVRQLNIQFIVDVGKAAKPVRREEVRISLRRHVLDAAKRDADLRLSR